VLNNTECLEIRSVNLGNGLNSIATPDVRMQDLAPEAATDRQPQNNLGQANCPPDGRNTELLAASV
jgi:hypothetical protein